MNDKDSPTHTLPHPVLRFNGLLKSLKRGRLKRVFPEKPTPTTLPGAGNNATKTQGTVRLCFHFDDVPN